MPEWWSWQSFAFGAVGMIVFSLVLTGLIVWYDRWKYGTPRQ